MSKWTDEEALAAYAATSGSAERWTERQMAVGRALLDASERAEKAEQVAKDANELIKALRDELTPISSLFLVDPIANAVGLFEGVKQRVQRCDAAEAALLDAREQVRELAHTAAAEAQHANELAAQVATLKAEVKAWRMCVREGALMPHPSRWLGSPEREAAQHARAATDALFKEGL